MKNLLMGTLTLMAFYCHAQTGKFSLALTQNTNFHPECNMEYIGVGGGLQAAWQINPRLQLASGLNFSREQTRITASFDYVDDNFTAGAVRNFVMTRASNSIEIPLELRFNVLQKEKWNLLLHVGTRQRIALTELVIPQGIGISHTIPIDFTSFPPPNGIFPDLPIENEIELLFDQSQYQAKGYDGFDTYFGAGINYQLSNNWSISLSSSGQFLETKKETILEEDSSKTVNWRLWTSVEEIRLNLGLVHHF